MTVRLGVLDIGSNSAQLQIVEATVDAPPLPLYAIKTATLLGESLRDNRCLENDAIERVCSAVTRTLHTAHRYELDQIYLFVTAAIRDAENREAVLDHIEAA